MKKKIIAVAVAAVLSASAYAQNAILQNEYIRAGVNQTTGTFGSGGNTSPGLLYNAAGSGTFNTSYDYLTPGSPFDGFSLKIDGTNYRNNNAGNFAQIAGGWTSGTTTSASGADWTGSVTHGGAAWSVRNQYSLPAAQQYIDITSTITAGTAASTVWFGRYIDPDARAAAGDSSQTDNVLGYGAIPVRNVAFSEALTSRYALGIYSANSNVWSGISGWSTEADGYQTSKYGALFGRGDDTIGLSWKFEGVNAGDTLTASYAYIFGPSAFGAASSAVTGGAGGGTPGTAPGGGTLVDVGSATSAATTGGSAPTVTGTSTVNGTASFADTAGSGIVLSTSHIAGNYLTRYYNTLTTTEVGRITTTPRTVITSYSDSTTTSAAGTPLTVSETYYRGVDVTHDDVATSVVADTANRTHIDTGSVSSVNPTVTPSSNYLTRSGTAITSGNIRRDTTTPTLFTYDRTTTIVTTNDFLPTSIYADTTSTVVSNSVVSETYNILTNENFTRTVTRTINDIATSAVADTTNRTHVDTGSVSISTPNVTASADYSTRTGFTMNSGIITRTVTTPTLFTYDRTINTETSDTFGVGSFYSNTSSSTTANSTVSETYNIVTVDPFTRTITRTINDISIGSEVIGTPIWVSNGIDNSSLVNLRQIPISTQNNKTLTVSTSGVITANELYTVTTPTRFTYNRTVNTTTTDDFAPTSIYTDSSSTVTDTSTVTGDYNVVTADQIGRTASYNVSVGLRTDQVSTVGQLQSMINRDIEFGKTVVYRYYDNNINGYRGHTTLFGVGHNKDISADTNFGFGVNSINTTLSGNASSVRSEGVQFGATLKKKSVKGVDLSGTVQHTITNYNVSATPSVAITTSGDSRLLATQAFNTSLPNVTGKTSGNDTSVTLRAIRSEGIIRPIVGGTVGKRTADGYTANINILPGTTVSNQVNNMNKDYAFATAGVQVKYDIFNATALHHTDGVNQYGAGLGKDKGNLTMNIRADRFENNQGGTNVYSANLVYKF